MVNTFLFLPTALSTPLSLTGALSLLQLRITIYGRFYGYALHMTLLCSNLFFFSPPGADQEHRPER